MSGAPHASFFSEWYIFRAFSDLKQGKRGGAAVGCDI